LLRVTYVSNNKDLSVSSLIKKDPSSGHVG
jgi:hypothetical protein